MGAFGDTKSENEGPALILSRKVVEVRAGFGGFEGWEESRVVANVRAHREGAVLVRGRDRSGEECRMHRDRGIAAAIVYDGGFCKTELYWGRRTHRSICQA